MERGLDRYVSFKDGSEQIDTAIRSLGFGRHISQQLLE